MLRDLKGCTVTKALNWDDKTGDPAMRILVCDDDRGVLDAYRAAFTAVAVDKSRTDLTALEASLFPDAEASTDSSADEFRLDITYAEQGVDAVGAVAESVRSGRPFQVVFLDMRMPPGIDGKAAARQIRSIDPDIHIVMVTGYSDSSPLDVAKVAGPLDKLFYVAKPFEVEEILQLARSLCQKWHIEAQLRYAHKRLEEQVSLLEDSNTQLKASEARISHAAFHDSLTGAPNRAAFLRELSERAQSKNTQYAVAMLDLDRFKAVNDNFGHAAGDELVRSVWASLSSILPAGAMAARIGGDEFGLILPSDDTSELADLCARVVAVCGSDRTIFGHTVHIGVSVGVAPAFEAGERDKMDIVRRADLALYAAKRSGRGQVQFFDEALDESARFRLKIETGLRDAIAKDQLSLAYQPIVDQSNLEVVGFEALLRWTSPEHGPVSPAIFVPIAEESGLIHELGDWILPRALKACRDWPHQYVSVNFSPRQFLRPGVKQRLLEAVAAAGLTPQRVQIEITETALFDNVADAAVILDELQASGFKVALDDFGTGYSSLFNLNSFNISCIKIDRSFVDALGREPNATAIVSAMTQLARSMGLSVVAEGVEDQFQHQALRMAGCSHMQGFRFGQPVDAAEAHERSIRVQAAAETQNAAVG